MRHPDSPLLAVPASHCFAVGRDGMGYIMLATFAEGFRAAWSNDGLDWPDSLTQLVFPRDQEWFDGFRCPDPQFDEDGRLHMYFKGFDKPEYEGPGGIGYAWSDDRGLTWTTHPDPVMTPAAAQMPSVVDTGVDGPQRYVMTYSKIHEGRFAVFIAFSPDHTEFVDHPDNPVLESRDLNWDDYAVSRPRLLVETPDKLHVIFTAQGTYPGEHSGRCVKFGHAVSFNGGNTWLYTDLDPILDVDPDPLAWDNVGIMVPSFTRGGPSSRLRLYYAGAAANGGITVGVVETLWPLGGFAVDVSEESSDASSAGVRLAFDAMPNPSSGETTFVLTLRAGLPAGETYIRIFDVAGRLVRRVWSGAAGGLPHAITWDGRDEHGADVAPGRYLAQVDIDGTAVAVRGFTRIR